MKVTLAYGRGGLDVELPDAATDVVEPRYAPGLVDDIAAIAAALESPLGAPPLRALAGPEDTVAIVVNDGTRPMPSARVLPPILAALDHVPRENITILVATGTHRANTPAELDDMLGPMVARGYRVVNHDARDPSTLVYLGTSALGHPIYLNRLYMESTVKILTGFVEPHFFAGYSGGPKPVMPGLAGLETVLGNHAPSMIAHPNATFGALRGNPIHEEQREIALRTNPTFSLNVTLNADHAITGVWAGALLAVHAAGVAFVRRTALREVASAYDVVLTTNSGYPLDQNLYQSVKGMAAAARAARSCSPPSAPTDSRRTGSTLISCVTPRALAPCSPTSRGRKGRRAGRSPTGGRRRSRRGSSVAPRSTSTRRSPTRSCAPPCSNLATTSAPVCATPSPHVAPTLACSSCHKGRKRSYLPPCPCEWTGKRRMSAVRRVRYVTGGVNKTEGRSACAPALHWFTSRSGLPRSARSAVVDGRARLGRVRHGQGDAQPGDRCAIPIPRRCLRGGQREVVGHRPRARRPMSRVCR